MSLFDDASLVLIPDGAKDGKLYSVKPTDGTGDFTFTRASSATRVNSDGLIEKETQNIVLYSNDFSQSNWVQVSTTRTSGESGYDGTNDAWELVRSSGGTLILNQALSLSGVYTLSCYVKINASNGFGIGFSSSAYALFNISDALQTSAVFTNNLISSSITYVGNNFYRITVTGNGSFNQVRLINAVVNGSSTSSGGGTHIVQDVQIEQGLVARDYIETTTTAVYGGITDNIPRLDYTDASCPSLLLEPQRTNLCPHSEYIEGLGLTDLTATPNATTSPEGVQNAYKMLTGTGGSEQIAYQAVGTSGNTKTQSVYIKADSGVQWIRLIQVRAGFANSASTHFDIQNGVKGAKEENGTTSVVDDATKIEDVGNGWYRLTLVCTDSTNNTNFDTRVRTAIADGSLTRVSNGSYFVWGYQMESDASYPTSYIPTYGTSVTRNIDICIKTSATSLIGQTQGTFFIEFVPLTSDPMDIFYFNQTTSSSVHLRGSNPINARIRIGSFSFQVNGGNMSVAQTYKVAVVYDESFGLKLFVNGVKYENNTPFTFAASLDTIVINTTAFWIGDGAIENKQSLVFPTALTDSECIALTTI